MLKFIRVSAFKSLVDFELPLNKFNCVIGLNGAGKSTVLQLISYASAMFRGDIPEWLNARNWAENEVVSHFHPRVKNLNFEIEFKFGDDNYLWKGTYNWEKGFCTNESLINIDSPTTFIYRVKKGALINRNGQSSDIFFRYSGSVLSVLEGLALPPEAKKLQVYMSELESHDMLSPKIMRAGKYSRQGRLGSTGEFLINYINNFETHQLNVLVAQLARYFPQVIELDTEPQSDGTLALLITERFYKEDGGHNDVTTDARHINDGMLRILNLLANQTEGQKFHLFDEIENGVNPEVTEKLVDSFAGSGQQMLFTTHSPMILNYIEDELAKESVIYIYKQKNGYTKACRFFAIPELERKLSMLAPGDAMLDVDLQSVALWAQKQSEAS